MPLLALLLALQEAPAPRAGELWAGALKAVAKPGEVAFQVQSPEAGKAAWRIAEDLRLKPLAEGTLTLEAGKPARVAAKLDRPGFLILELTQGGKTALAAAAVEPASIASVAREPADFDDFWRGEIAALRKMPLKAQAARTDKSVPGLGPHAVHKVVLEMPEGRKAWAWVVRPEGKGPFPVVLEFPPFGSAALAVPHPVPGAIWGLVSVHASDLEAPVKDAYQPDGAEDRRKNYYRGAVLGGLRMLDHLLELPGADAKRVATTGKSQGGGLAILVAGLDPRVTHLSAVVPAFGQHAGTRQGRSSGFPSWVWHRDKDGRRDEADRVLREAEYYELAHFAKRFKGSAHVMVAWLDTVCPPSSVVAAFNAFPGPRELVHGVEQDHDWNRAGANWWPLWNARLKDFAQGR